MAPLLLAIIATIGFVHSLPERRKAEETGRDIGRDIGLLYGDMYEPPDTDNSSHKRLLHMYLHRPEFLTSRGPMMQTPLMLAAFLADAPAVAFLLQQTPDVNVQDAGGVTALFWASAGGNTEVARKLLAKGARVDMETAGGETALLYAAHYERAQMVELLLREGSNPNHRNQYGNTALINAADGFKHDQAALRIARALVKHGADVNARNRSGQTAQECAREAGFTAMADLLRTLSARPRRLITEPARAPVSQRRSKGELRGGVNAGPAVRQDILSQREASR